MEWFDALTRLHNKKETPEKWCTQIRETFQSHNTFFSFNAEKAKMAKSAISHLESGE